MTTAPKLMQEELELLLEVLPPQVASNLRGREDLEELLEVVLDLGRSPEARFPSGDVVLDEREVSREDLDHMVVLPRPGRPSKRMFLPE